MSPLEMKKFLNNYLIPYLLFIVFRIWCFTLRSHHKNPEGEKYLRGLSGRFIITMWHGRIFYLFYHCRKLSDLYLLISPSQDGDILARLAQLMGYSVIRGSSFKKAVPSARSLIKVLRREGRIAIIADGSRGPCCKVQSGLLQIAAITETPVVPLTFSAKHKLVFNSWDRFVLPLPFTRCTVNAGNPMHLTRQTVEHSQQEKQMELESGLNQLTVECE
jgi:lysophospholipid acyltransferase (LPLAT)-like uncharacterized protein